MTAATAPLTSYTILSQVKSARVVYFTDDPDYVPPTDGDWYFASPYVGALPDGMTLRNCWSWRFNGNSFVLADVKGPRSTADRLVDSNRAALMRILNEKIDQIRKPYAASSVLGETIRSLKFDEARAWLHAPTSRPSFAALEAVALARNMSMQAAAELVCLRAAQTDEMLIATERVRERFALLIQNAQSNDELLRLRNALMHDVYPELSTQLRFSIPNTTPRDPMAPLSEHQAVHEKSRLRAMLRERINDVRASVDGGYAAQAEIMKFKAKAADWVLTETGARPSGVKLLEEEANARHVSLEETARRVLKEFAHSSQLLWQTEQARAQLDARIDSISTVGEIELVDRMIVDTVARLAS
jgi:hypothetical protein